MVKETHGHISKWRAAAMMARLRPNSKASVITRRILPELRLEKVDFMIEYLKGAANKIPPMLLNLRSSQVIEAMRDWREYRALIKAFAG